MSCRLVRIGKQFRRPVSTSGRIKGDVFTFADGYPFLAISEASLADLNDRISRQGEEAVPMNRFRPNLVISGSSAFAEDNWPRLKIGSVFFDRVAHVNDVLSRRPTNSPALAAKSLCERSPPIGAP